MPSNPHSYAVSPVYSTLTIWLTPSQQRCEMKFHNELKADMVEAKKNEG